MVLALVLPFLSALFSRPLEGLKRRSAALLGSATGAASFMILLAVWISRGPTVATFPWVPSAGISFILRFDALAFLFSTLVTGVGSLIISYSYGYMAHEGETPRFYAYMSLFMGSMLGLVLAGDLILLFLFWELTTLSSFLLIGFRREERRSIAAALKALLITGLGGLTLLISFLLMRFAIGSFDMAVVLSSGDLLRTRGLLAPVLLLFAVAVAAKSAQFPLHIWLPDAMVAPTPVSAYLHSAAMVKAGIYLLARFLPALVAGGWELVFIPLGTATMVLGGLQAIRSTDLKRILAYSTISQLGLLVSAFGTAILAGQEAGLFHLLNHAVMKSSLFLVAGIVTLSTGLTSIRQLGGLGRKMPLTAAACGLAALSLAGLPPLGGFLSKEVYYEAALDSGLIWLPLLAVVGGGLTFAYSLYFFSKIFLGEAKGEVGREGLSTAMPALALAVIALLIGLFPSVASGLVSSAAHAEGEVAFAPSLLSLSLNPLLMSLASILIGTLILWRYEAVAEFLSRGAAALVRGTADALYEGLIGASRQVARSIALVVQNGSVRRYTGILLLFAILTLIWPLPVQTFEMPALATTRDVVLAIILVAMAIFAALAAALRRTLHAVLSLSGMGFLLATAFMLLNAPDLAMTQILVEMVILVVFLMVLYKIPFRAIQPPRRRGTLDALLSIGMVLGVTTLVALSLSAFLLPSVASYFLEVPVELTGGRNVVNVVVTDFRAFDTLGEITVIGLASLAVYTLLRRWSGD